MIRETTCFLPVLLMSLIFLGGCGSEYGTKMEFNGGELYHTSSISTEEATRLGEYLVAEEFFDGNEKTVQLDKSGSTYEFRMVVKEGLDQDEDYVANVKYFAAELSEEVFNGDQIDIHLCDEFLSTIRVILAPDFGEKMEFNGGDLYRTATVTEEEATRLGNYLVAGEFFDGNEKTVQLNKNGSTYEFRMVVKLGLDQDPDFIEVAKAFATELSEDVFQGEQVDIHLCDDNLNTLRVVVVF